MTLISINFILNIVRAISAIDKKKGGNRMSTQFNGDSVVSGRFKVRIRGIGESTVTIINERLRDVAVRVFCAKIGIPVANLNPDYIEFVLYDPEKCLAVFRRNWSVSLLPPKG